MVQMGEGQYIESTQTQGTSRSAFRMRKRFGGWNIVLVTLIGAAFAWYHRPFWGGLLDGPFTGTPIPPALQQEPSDLAELWGGMRLEAFDPARAEESPRLQLREADGSVQWSICADGCEPGDVRELRFGSASLGWVAVGQVDGSVRWVYGHEAAVFQIKRSGTLVGYWFSW